VYEHHVQFQSALAMLDQMYNDFDFASSTGRRTVVAMSFHSQSDALNELTERSTETLSTPRRRQLVSSPRE